MKSSIKHACYVDSLQRSIKNMQVNILFIYMAEATEANILQCRGPLVQVQVNILQRSSIKAAPKIMLG